MIAKWFHEFERLIEDIANIGDQKNLRQRAKILTEDLIKFLADLQNWRLMVLSKSQSLRLNLRIARQLTRIKIELLN